MNKFISKAMLAFSILALLNACSIIAVADTAIDVALIPVKVGVAVVDAAIPDGD
jgi:hypothetical protein